MAQLKSTQVIGDLSVTGGLSASTIIKIGGTSSQLLVADGSVKTATSEKTANTVVLRDADNNFSVGTVNGNLKGAKIEINSSEIANNGLYIRRGVSDNETLLLKTESGNGAIYNVNETKQSILNLNLEYKDTANNGASAATKTIIFTGNSNGTDIQATTFTGRAQSVKTSDGSSNAERKILVTSESATGQNIYSVSGVTANYEKKTITAAGGFIGNASTASKWATARIISISSTAGTTGTSVDGQINATLVIPKTISGFSSISADAIYVNSNTAAGSRGLIVTRTGNESESVRIGVNDSEAQFIYTNDEAASNFKFQLVNTDTESGNGAKANTATVTFSGASGKSTVSADTFSGALNGNAATATKVNNKLTINGKTFDGSGAVDVGTIGTAYGGTGLTSFTQHRLLYTSSSSAISQGYYANGAKMAVGQITEPTETFYVKGDAGVSGFVKIAGEVTLQYDSTLKAMKFVF